MRNFEMKDGRLIVHCAWKADNGGPTKDPVCVELFHLEKNAHSYEVTVRVTDNQGFDRARKVFGEDALQAVALGLSYANALARSDFD